jgi:uncharacterized protein with NAD-binding domain and iron-sulfur cluster
MISIMLTMMPLAVQRVVVVGSGWGGLSAAHTLSQQSDVQVTVVSADKRPGGLVSDSFLTPGGRRAEAGQHGFWDEYGNIFGLIDSLNLPEDPLTGYAEQGQYSPKGKEAIWPVYRDSSINLPKGLAQSLRLGAQGLPTGLAQAILTRFENISPLELATAAPLVLAFSEFDDSPEAWEKYDKISFRDLCVKLGVSRRLYKAAFEPMILTGLFAPGEECSAAAALGMAYFFVLKHQNSFDVRWCKGNVGELIFAPWVEQMEARGVKFLQETRAVDFTCDEASGELRSVLCQEMPTGDKFSLDECDQVVFAVGGAALSGLVRSSPALAQHAEWRRFANLRGLGVLATRLFLDVHVPTEYTANACWGFDDGVGMTFFDIKRLHAPRLDFEPGSVLEVDFYHSNSLLVMSDEAIIQRAKAHLDTILGDACKRASVVDAAIVRLPNAVNWYAPGSYNNMPDLKSSSIKNAYFVGDLVRTRHGSWSQEKAFVTGKQAANVMLGRDENEGVVPLKADEVHVDAGRKAVGLARTVLGGGDAKRGPSLVDFLW